ncbi:hypothetical protein NA56DRAFT_194115 [Hyaloscypha hepaticicola]|uniref:Heterokaryon incompatibility domain-containing protein n=1 Tax=Hyaloscypha hepaticicola TaxID=2082293 RepID=A0A2J6PZW2_9HELO|nr:hypothetical protein NA56DRAFT_194115 [Hyaloscypha hepaticicola]
MKNWAWKAVSRFLALPYWTRVWVFQETCLAKHLMFVCNSHFPSFEKLFWVCWRIKSLKSALRRLGRRNPDFLSRSAWKMLSPWGYGAWSKIYQIASVQTLLRGQGGLASRLGLSQSWSFLCLGRTSAPQIPKTIFMGF